MTFGKGDKRRDVYIYKSREIVKRRYIRGILRCTGQGICKNTSGGFEVVFRDECARGVDVLSLINVHVEFDSVVFVLMRAVTSRYAAWEKLKDNVLDYIV